MMFIYVVKIGEQFFCIVEDGDIGMVLVIEDVVFFGLYDEVEKVVSVYVDLGYEIVVVCVIRY